MNNLALLNQTTKTMSSYDLLVLINRARADFGESLVRLNDFNARVADELDGEHYEIFVVQNPNNTQSTHYQMTLDQCMLVSMRESKAVRRQVLQQLKDKQSALALPDFNNPVEAARAWADAMERQQLAIAQVAQLQPKADALDAITHAKGNSNIRDTAKALGAKQSDFISWCLKHGWLYRDDCERLKAYANRIQQGLMAQKSVLYRGSDSTERATMQPMFTPKGLTHLAKIYTREVA